MPHLFQIFSQTDYLIQTVDIISHTERQTVQIQISWFLRSQLIWIYTVCKGGIYPGSAGQGLRIDVEKNIFTVSFGTCRPEQTVWTQIRMWHLIRIYTVCHTSSTFFTYQQKVIKLQAMHHAPPLQCIKQVT